MTPSRFELFPRYEDQTPNLAFGIGGLVGLGMLAYIITLGLPHDPPISNVIVGTTGWTLALAADLYFVTRPSLFPQAYDIDTVNSTMTVALKL